MRIPEIQQRLYEKASQYNDNELHTLAHQLSRRSPRRIAAISSTPMTDELAQEIRAYVRDNPDLSQVAVASMFNVNPGRVSEVVRGFRT